MENWFSLTGSSRFNQYVEYTPAPSIQSAKNSNSQNKIVYTKILLDLIYDWHVLLPFYVYRSIYVNETTHRKKFRKKMFFRS